MAQWKRDGAMKHDDAMKGDGAIETRWRDEHVGATTEARWRDETR
jgi:hypothetical protein